MGVSSWTSLLVPSGRPGWFLVAFSWPPCRDTQRKKRHKSSEPPGPVTVKTEPGDEEPGASSGLDDARPAPRDPAVASVASSSSVRGVSASRSSSDICEGRLSPRPASAEAPPG